MIYSFPFGLSSGTPGVLHGFQLSGPGEVPFDRIKPLLADGENHSRTLLKAIDAILEGEEAKSLARTYR